MLSEEVVLLLVAVGLVEAVVEVDSRIICGDAGRSHHDWSHNYPVGTTTGEDEHFRTDLDLIA